MASSKRPVYGRGLMRNKRDGAMGKLELRYAAELERRRLAGEIARWDFEPERLRLADKSYYIPDFRVMRVGGLIEFHEVKGFWEANARTKIKIAASQHPYVFVALKPRLVREGGGWSVEEF